MVGRALLAPVPRCLRYFGRSTIAAAVFHLVFRFVDLSDGLSICRRLARRIRDRKKRWPEFVKFPDNAFGVSGMTPPDADIRNGGVFLAARVIANFPPPVQTVAHLIRKTGRSSHAAAFDAGSLCDRGGTGRACRRHESRFLRRARGLDRARAHGRPSVAYRLGAVEGAARIGETRSRYQERLDIWRQDRRHQHQPQSRLGARVERRAGDGAECIRRSA